MAVYFDSEPIIVHGDEGIAKDAIERDIYLLIHSFAKKKSHSLAVFEGIWKEYNFSLIHFACADQQGRPQFMQAINEAILEHFQFSSNTIRLGVVYALYLMYYSQPEIWPRESIRMTKERWESFHSFAEQCALNRELADGYITYVKLLYDNAFKFCALPTFTHRNVHNALANREIATVDEYLRDIRKKHFEHNISSHFDSEKLQNLETLSKKYMDAKQELFYTRHGTLAAQKLMQDLANIHETNPTHLRRVLQSSSLGSGDEDFIKSTNDLIVRYEEARFNSTVPVKSDTSQE